MSSRRTYRVKEVSRLTGVSVRALHHYDEIGLLHPSTRSAAGYRLYTDEDLLRLQQILLGRELGLGLEEIRRSFEDPSFDERHSLLRHREALTRRAEDTARMIRAVDVALAQLARRETRERTTAGSSSTPPEAFPTENTFTRRPSGAQRDLPDEPTPPTSTGEPTMDTESLFDGFDPARYEKEAEQRWGHTDAYRESMRRTANYGPEDWQRHKDEQDAIYAAALELLQDGVAPTSPAAMDVAERHRLSIDQWFYPCGAEMHAGLADLIENDPRFAANIDRFGPGLTRFLVAAIRANAARHEGDAAGDAAAPEDMGST